MRLAKVLRCTSFSIAICLFLYALLEQAGQQYLDTKVGGVKILPHSTQLFLNDVITSWRILLVINNLRQSKLYLFAK